jgi:hypothetical protein
MSDPIWYPLRMHTFTAITQSGPSAIFRHPTLQFIPSHTSMMSVELCARTYRCVFVFQHQYGCDIGATHQSQPQRFDAVINMHAIHLVRSVEFLRDYLIIFKPCKLANEVLDHKISRWTTAQRRDWKLTRQWIW